MIRILHASDLHFGAPVVMEQIEGLVADIKKNPPDLVAFSGDFSQRARAAEFQAASLVIREVEQFAPTITVPGNHDVAWWFAPVDIGIKWLKLAKYKKYLAADIEPVVAVDGVTAVGLNTSHGITVRTLTKRPRDLSIIGDVTPEQMSALKSKLARAETGSARIVVMHHNPVRGDLSQRYGMKAHKELLEELAASGVEVVLCGHDHQESITQTHNGIVVCVAGTLSNRSRGGRPSAYNIITIRDRVIEVEVRAWAASAQAYKTSANYSFPRVRNA